MLLKKRTIISTILIIASIAGTLFWLYCSKDDYEPADFDQIEQRGTLRIVTNMDPIGYFVSADSISGYNYEILNALQKYTDIKFEVFLENSLEKSFEGLEDGTYDIIARNIAINASLRNKYGFTTPILYNKLILVQRKSEFNDSIPPIRNHLQLAKKTIYVPKNSPSLLRLQNLSKEIGDSIYLIEDGLYEADQLSLMVASGEIDFAICDERTAQKLASKIPELDVNTDIGFTHLESWAVRSASPTLLDSLNTWIDRFKKTKEYSLLEKKYSK